MGIKTLPISDLMVCLQTNSLLLPQSGHLEMNEKQGIYRIRVVEDLLVRQFGQ